VPYEKIVKNFKEEEEVTEEVSLMFNKLISSAEAANRFSLILKGIT